MDSWKLDVEESAKLIPKGILCIIRSDNKKMYVRVKAHKNDLIELVPLTKAEMVEAEIQETDQTINDLFDVTVEESDNEFSNPEVQKKFEEEQAKKKGFSLNNLEDAKRAELIAKSAREILEKKNPEEIQAENEDLRAKLELIASKQLELKMNQLNVPESLKPTFRQDPSKLQGYEMGRAQYYPVNSEVPSGSAPLNFQQTGISNELSKMQFENPIMMVQYLRERAKTDPEARQILDALFIKGLKGADRSGESQGLTLKDLRKKGKENPNWRTR